MKTFLFNAGFILVIISTGWSLVTLLVERRMARPVRTVPQRSNKAH